MPPKIMDFLWLLAKYIPLTWDNLHKCGWIDPNVRVLCSHGEESSQHNYLIYTSYLDGLYKHCVIRTHRAISVGTSIF